LELYFYQQELTHVTQRHTLDVLIIEILQIIFWINPLFIFLKKAIQLNHEFLADEKVINQHKNTFQYQHLLLNKVAWNNEYYLTSNLNYSLTKKRLNMMTTQSSHTKILLKKLTVIPLLIGFIFLFAERIKAQEKNETIYKQSENLQNDKTDADLYKEFVYQHRYIQTTGKNGKKVSKKYSELSENEKKKLPPPPPLKRKKKVPSKKLIEDLKDSSKYAIWIDEKVVKNEILNNYKSSDFSNFFVNFVHKNARSKRFAQEYQVSLSTKRYFDVQNTKKETEFEIYKKQQKQFKNAKWQQLPNGERIKVIEDSKLSNFKIQLEKKENSINLKCLKGCEWKTLNFTLNKNSEKTINKYGLDQKESDTSFQFILTNNDNVIALKSAKGTVWKGLSFSADENQKLIIDQYGVELINNESVTYYLDNKLISKEELNTISPEKIASVDVKKNEDGSGSIYIRSKKE